MNAGLHAKTGEATRGSGPVFLFGEAFSGISIVGKALSTLDGFYGGEQQESFASHLAGAYHAIGVEQARRKSGATIDKSAMAPLAQGLGSLSNFLWLGADTRKPGARWIERAPALISVQKLESFAALFPDAKFIFCISSPEQEIETQIAAWPVHRPRIGPIAERWSTVAKTWRELSARLTADDVLSIYSEELFVAPRVAAQRLGRLLGLSPKQIARLAIAIGGAAREPAKLNPPLTPDEVAAIAQNTQSEVANWPGLRDPERARRFGTTSTYRSLRDENFSIRIPAPSEAGNSFVLSVHKAGSVLFNAIVQELATAAGRPTLNVEGQTFRQGVLMEHWPPELLKLFDLKGYLFHGFRALGPLDQAPGFNDAQKLILVRDPRDVMVSYYFSVAKSHAVPGSGSAREKLMEERRQAGEVDVDLFISTGACDFIADNMRKYIPYAKSENTRLYRYEDVIFDKANWVADIAKTLQIDLSAEILAEIAARHDVRPDAENPDAHVRQVKPGNFKKHLSEETSAAIAAKFPEVFEFYGYR